MAKSNKVFVEVSAQAPDSLVTPSNRETYIQAHYSQPKVRILTHNTKLHYNHCKAFATPECFLLIVHLLKLLHSIFLYLFY